MKRNRLLLPVSALAALCLGVPGLAQAAPPAQDQNAANQNTPQLVQIAVDVVDATGAELRQASRKLPAGPNHDALLRAALIKAGAQDTLAPRVETTDNVRATLDFVTPLPAPTPNNPQQVLSLHNKIGARPHVNADGTITVTVTARRDEQTTTVTPPAVTTSRFSTTRTFHDGQTLLLTNQQPGVKATSQVEMVFAQVKTRS